MHPHQESRSRQKAQCAKFFVARLVNWSYQLDAPSRSRS